MGAEVAEMALPTLALLFLDASPVQAGLLIAMPWLVFLVAGLPAGVLIDRLPRRRVMVFADAGRCAALASIPIVFAAGRLDLGWLYAVAAVAGVLGVCSQLAFRSFLPELVERDDLLEGNAKLMLGEGTAKVAGPSVAGLVIQAVGAPATLFASAACAMLSALCGARLPDSRRARRSERTGSVIAEAREGLVFVLTQPALRRITAVNTLGNLGTGIVDGVALVFAYRVLRLDPGAVGLAMAAGSLGFFATAAASNRITRALGVGPTLAWSSFVYALAPIALAFGALGLPIVAVTLWRLLYGTSLPPYDVNAATIRQTATPARLQGRAIAAINTIGWGALGLGPLLGGLLGERFGALPAILVGVVLCLVAVIPTVVPRPIVLERLHRADARVSECQCGRASTESSPIV
jgi:MFS family permease